MNSLLRLMLLGVISAVGLAPAAGDVDETFRADLNRLTSRPHRLAGTEPGLEASRFLEKRLRDGAVV